MAQSSTRGASTLGKSKIEILGLTPHALWLLIRGQEYMLDFVHFPWFRQASIEDVQTVEMHFDHLYWPTLDVDLHLDSLAHPERFPLVARQAEQTEHTK